MNVTGCIRIDLTAVPEDRHRSRVAAALGDAPNGATVELVVGTLRVGAEAVRLIRQFADERRLSLIVKGETRAVRNWVSAVRTGEVCGMLL